MGEGINWKRVVYQGQWIWAADFLDGVLVDTEGAGEKGVAFVPGWKVKDKTGDMDDNVLTRRGPKVERWHANG